MRKSTMKADFSPNGHHRRQSQEGCDGKVHCISKIYGRGVLGHKIIARQVARGVLHFATDLSTLPVLPGVSHFLPFSHGLTVSRYFLPVA